MHACNTGHSYIWGCTCWSANNVCTYKFCNLGSSDTIFGCVYRMSIHYAFHCYMYAVIAAIAILKGVQVRVQTTNALGTNFCKLVKDTILGGPDRIYLIHPIGLYMGECRRQSPSDNHSKLSTRDAMLWTYGQEPPHYACHWYMYTVIAAIAIFMEVTKAQQCATASCFTAQKLVRSCCAIPSTIQGR